MLPRAIGPVNCDSGGLAKFGSSSEITLARWIDLEGRRARLVVTVCVRRTNLLAEVLAESPIDVKT